eukprot:338235-Pyramimonas_sp.AAC.1
MVGLLRVSHGSLGLVGVSGLGSRSLSGLLVGLVGVSEMWSLKCRLALLWGRWMAHLVWEAPRDIARA